MLSISIIDVQWPGDVVRTARAAERAGYRRYWLTEHHSPAQSGSPCVLAAIAAGATKKIRIGTAGVLLNLHSPMEVAEEFQLLELFYPGRIDAGITGGLPGGRAHHLLLDARKKPSFESYQKRVRELAAILQGRAPEVKVGPRTPAPPPLWICGMSERAAVLAAELGACFAYNESMSRNESRAVAEGPEVVATYRRELERRRDRAKGRPNERGTSFTVVSAGMCAKSEELARRHLDEYCESRDKDLKPTFLGEPETCAEQIRAIADAYGSREITVQCLCNDAGARISAYRLLARALGIRRSSR